MTILYIILGIIGLILIAFFLLGFIAPKEFNYSRSKIIKASKEEIYPFVSHLKEMNQWSPWAERDPNIKNEFTGTDGTIGAVHKWEGGKGVGVGEQELTKLVPNERVESELRFYKPWKATNKAFIQLDNTDEGTKVTWGFGGKTPFPANVFMMLMNVEKHVGKDFDRGLTRLNNLVGK